MLSRIRVIGTGFAHKATKDIIWGGYLVPKGASVIGNVWCADFTPPSLHYKRLTVLLPIRSIGRDPEYFPDPEKFDPQRWMTKEGTLREDLHTYSFGSGRRVCPGQHIATA